MRISRRKLVGSLSLAAAFAGAPMLSAYAQGAFIPRVGGEVTARNFEPLTELATRSVNSVVGLKISVADGEHDGLVAKETGGLLIIYMRKGDVELSFPSGYRKDGDRFFFDGFYNATYAGQNQGITGIHLTPARTMDVDATGKPVKEFAIDDLPKAKGG